MVAETMSKPVTWAVPAPVTFCPVGMEMPALAVMRPEIVGVVVQVVGPMMRLEPLIVVEAPTLPKVRAVCVAVPILKATAVAVSRAGARKDVAAVTVPVKFAVEEMVCPLMRPLVMVPMLTKLPFTSMRLVPAPAPVLIPVVPFRVVPVMVFAVLIVPKPEAMEPVASAPVVVSPVIVVTLF